MGARKCARAIQSCSQSSADSHAGYEATRTPAENIITDPECGMLIMNRRTRANITIRHGSIRVPDSACPERGVERFPFGCEVHKS
jgi:hypothetical protein